MRPDEGVFSVKRFFVWLGLSEPTPVLEVPARLGAFNEAVAAFDSDAPTEAVLARYLDRVVGA